VRTIVGADAKMTQEMANKIDAEFAAAEASRKDAEQKVAYEKDYAEKESVAKPPADAASWNGEDATYHMTVDGVPGLISVKKSGNAYQLSYYRPGKKKDLPSTVTAEQAKMMLADATGGAITNTAEGKKMPQENKRSRDKETVTENENAAESEKTADETGEREGREERAEKSEDKPMTRGDAVAAMYNTLRTTMKNSARMLSEKLAAKGVMSHSDAVFLLWSTDAEETKAYMDAVGYTAEWIIPDGYYTIRASETEDCVLNVLADGPNRDYEGLGVTLWRNTDDITQSFRLERTARGTYLIYAACSRGGFNRVLGVGRDGVSVGLYRDVSASALEFSIQGDVDGTWRICGLTKNGEKYLTAGGLNNGAAIRLADETETALTWIIEKQGIINSAGQDLALFPAQTMQITQGAYDTYSHQSQNALDMQPTNGMAFAPFNAKVVAVNPGYATCNGVWIESINKVRYADGSYDYMTVLYMHDNDIADLTVGRVLTQGEYFYRNGTAGISTGAHIHLAVYRGKYDAETMKFGTGDVYAQDAFFVLDDTVIRNDYGLDWKSVSEAD